MNTNSHEQVQIDYGRPLNPGLATILHECSPQTSIAVSTIVLSLYLSSSIEIRLPTIDVEKPHCVLRARRSSGTYRLASLIRSFSSSRVSLRGDFVVTRPKTTSLSSGTSRR